MANIRVLELAKELRLDASEILSVARDCGVAVAGPTSQLTDEDRLKIAKP